MSGNRPNLCFSFSCENSSIHVAPRTPPFYWYAPLRHAQVARWGRFVARRRKKDGGKEFDPHFQTSSAVSCLRVSF